jgi:hypothetical protein
VVLAAMMFKFDIRSYALAHLRYLRYLKGKSLETL